MPGPSTPGKRNFANQPGQATVPPFLFQHWQQIVWRLRRCGEERPAPRWLWLLFLLALTGQMVWASHRPAPTAQAADLPRPPSVAVLRLAALGEEPALARLLMLWLQAFDNQPGVSIPFKELNYGLVEEWLSRILALDPRSRYPLFSASRVYAVVNDPARKRSMAHWVHRQFLDDPDRRWFALAHVAVMAKHELRDLPFALQLSQSLARHAGPTVPHWATQMELFLLEEMGEVETARILLGGLLESGQITDPHERNLLMERLTEMEASADKAGRQVGGK